jgi:hypothetical protein
VASVELVASEDEGASDAGASLAGPSEPASGLAGRGQLQRDRQQALIVPQNGFPGQVFASRGQVLQRQLKQSTPASSNPASASPARHAFLS